jgi:hypothetical protein
VVYWGRSHAIELDDEFRQPAVIWTATVAESGDRKTPAFSLVTKPLLTIETELAEKTASSAEAYRVAEFAYKASLDAWKKAKGKTSVDPPHPPDKPPEYQLLTSDITLEALAELLAANWRGIILASPELAGWVASFDVYRSRGGKDQAAWLNIHDAGFIKVNRKIPDPVTKKRMVFIPQACVSVLGTIQPGVLLRSLDESAQESGLAARILLAAPTWVQGTWTNRQQRPDDLRGSVARMELLYRHLYELEPAQDADGNPLTRQVRMSRDAEGLWAIFYDESQHERSLMLDLWQRRAWPKLEGYCARFALLFWAVRRALQLTRSETIDPESMETAITLTKWFQGETERVHDLLARTPREQELDMLVSIAEQAGGKLTPRQLMRRIARYRDSADVAREALKRLVDAGLAEWSTNARSEFIILRNPTPSQ